MKWERTLEYQLLSGPRNYKLWGSRGIGEGEGFDGDEMGQTGTEGTGNSG